MLSARRCNSDNLSYCRSFSQLLPMHAGILLLSSAAGVAPDTLQQLTGTATAEFRQAGQSALYNAFQQPGMSCGMHLHRLSAKAGRRASRPWLGSGGADKHRYRLAGGCGLCRDRRQCADPGCDDSPRLQSWHGGARHTGNAGGRRPGTGFRVWAGAEVLSTDSCASFPGMELK